MHFYSGMQELLCRVVLLDRDVLEQGESGYAQLCMESDAVLCPGDRFVVRFYSPMETVGGGEVLEVTEYREKRFREAVLERLAAREEGNISAIVEAQMRTKIVWPADSREIAKVCNLREREVREVLPQMCEQKLVICIQPERYPEGEKQRQQSGVLRQSTEWFYIHSDIEMRLREKVLQEMSAYHAAWPFRMGISPAQLAPAVFPKCDRERAEVYFEWLCSQKVLRTENSSGGAVYSLPERDAELAHFCRQAGRKLEQAAREAGYRFLDRSRTGEILCEMQTEAHRGPQGSDRPKGSSGGIMVSSQSKDLSGYPIISGQQEEALRLLEQRGIVVHVSEGFYTVPSIINQITEQIRDILESDGRVTVSQVRDLCKEGRKHAKLILDYTDRMQITEKSGAESERIRHS